MWYEFIAKYKYLRWPTAAILVFMLYCLLVLFYEKRKTSCQNTPNKRLTRLSEAQHFQDVV